VIDVPKNDAEKNDLAAEPKNLDHHPQQEVRLETQIPDERVAQHDGIDFDVTAHHLWLSLICSTPSIDRLVMLSEALQRNAKHKARLSNISICFLRQPIQK
jgi:hypothetical protein